MGVVAKVAVVMADGVGVEVGRSGVVLESVAMGAVVIVAVGVAAQL